MTPEEYLKNRVENQIAWYSKNSTWNKHWFIALQMMTLVAAGAVPVFAIFSGDMWARVIVAILGSVTAIITGVVSLFRFREHWTEYRTTAESLKHEKYMYQTKTEPYTGDYAFALLVERVEALVSQENSKWQQLQKSQKSDEKSALTQKKD